MHFYECGRSANSNCWCSLAALEVPVLKREVFVMENIKAFMDAAYPFFMMAADVYFIACAVKEFKKEEYLKVALNVIMILWFSYELFFGNR
ncbi:MAG: hypothetical protein SPI19_00150 [Peptoniphilaceae bacterium]|nr:hypothetical protein [Peptoniphilaceae bacterium]